jgi:hypothetical protein
VIKYSFVVFLIFGDSPAPNIKIDTSVPKHRHIKLKNREITQNKNTTISTRQILQSRISILWLVLFYIICSLCFVPFIVLVCCAGCQGPFGCELRTIINKNWIEFPCHSPHSVQRGSRDVVAGKVTGLWDGEPRNLLSISGRGKRFCEDSVSECGGVSLGVSRRFERSATTKNHEYLQSGYRILERNSSRAPSQFVDTLLNLLVHFYELIHS